jgi:hypothetical protein
MNKRLFLYIDILGFSEIVRNNENVLRLYRLIDQARIHHDSHFRVIVFSDTIVAYNINSNYSDEPKAVEVMYLIELTQDFFHKLIGTNIFFRAIITEGEFFHTELDNLQAYFGEALVDAYSDEKKLTGTGLFVHKKLRKSNQVFRFKDYSDKYDYIYLTHICSGITSWLARDVEKIERPDFSEYPLHPDLLTSAGYEYMVYPELVHFKEVYQNMNSHLDPKVRSIYLSTWNMYTLAYPGLMQSLVRSKFDPNGMSILDWRRAKKMYEEEKAESGKGGVLPRPPHTT